VVIMMDPTRTCEAAAILWFALVLAACSFSLGWALRGIRKDKEK